VGKIDRALRLFGLLSAVPRLPYDLGARGGYGWSGEYHGGNHNRLSQKGRRIRKRRGK